MANPMPFGEILEAVDRLSLEEQESLVEVLRRRIIESRRDEIVRDIQQAQKEFQEGLSKPVTPSDLMKDITQ